MNDGIWIIDSQAQTLFANTQMGEILGVPAAELIGQPSFAFVFPEDIEAAQCLFDAKAKGETNAFHFKLRRKDGSAIWVDVQGTPMHNAEGTFLGIVGTFRVLPAGRKKAS